MSRGANSARPAKIRGTSPHSFRKGEWATIVGVALFTPANFEERLCYVVMYPDGDLDYISIQGGDYDVQA